VTDKAVLAEVMFYFISREDRHRFQNPKLLQILALLY